MLVSLCCKARVQSMGNGQYKCSQCGSEHGEVFSTDLQQAVGTSPGSRTTMTVEALMRARLFEAGLWDADLDDAIARAKDAPVNAPFKDRWADSTEGYEAGLLSALWFGVKASTLEWIKETCPEAHFRSYFDDVAEVI